VHSLQPDSLAVYLLLSFCHVLLPVFRGDVLSGPAPPPLLPRPRTPTILVSFVSVDLPGDVALQIRDPLFRRKELVERNACPLLRPPLDFFISRQQTGVAPFQVADFFFSRNPMTVRLRIEFPHSRLVLPRSLADAYRELAAFSKAP